MIQSILRLSDDLTIPIWLRPRGAYQFEALLSDGSIVDRQWLQSIGRSSAPHEDDRPLSYLRPPRCRNGHTRSERNTRIDPQGYPHCRLCAKKSRMKRRERQADLLEQWHDRM